MEGLMASTSLALRCTGLPRDACETYTSGCLWHKGGNMCVAQEPLIDLVRGLARVCVKGEATPAHRRELVSMARRALAALGASPAGLSDAELCVELDKRVKRVKRVLEGINEKLYDLIVRYRLNSPEAVASRDPTVAFMAIVAALVPDIPKTEVVAFMNILAMEASVAHATRSYVWDKIWAVLKAPIKRQRWSSSPQGVRIKRLLMEGLVAMAQAGAAGAMPDLHAADVGTSGGGPIAPSVSTMTVAPKGAAISLPTLAIPAMGGPAVASSATPVIPAPPLPQPWNGRVPGISDGPMVEVDLSAVGATAVSKVPEVDGLPSHYISVLDVKKPGLARFGRFNVHRGTMEPVETDETLGAAKDLEAIATVPGHSGLFGAMTSAGRLYMTELSEDGRLSARQTLDLPKLAGYCNYEALTMTPHPTRPRAVVVRFGQRGGNSKFGSLDGTTASIDLVEGPEGWALDKDSLQKGHISPPKDNPHIRVISDVHRGLFAATTDIDEMTKEQLADIEAGGYSADKDTSIIYGDHTAPVLIKDGKVEGLFRSSDHNSFDIITDDEHRGSTLVRFQNGFFVGARLITSVKNLGGSGIVPASGVDPAANPIPAILTHMR